MKTAGALLLFDVGNTHIHVGIARRTRVRQTFNLPTHTWSRRTARTLRRRLGSLPIRGVALCSVVPRVSPSLIRWLRQEWKVPLLELNHRNVRGIGIDYPAPATIGPDRLANAVAVRALYGCPAVVVDFGTAVTFDVVDRHGNYVGGIIAPGLTAMTDYLHEKTAMLPRISIRNTRAIIGKNTTEAMLIGAVRGYRGLVRNLMAELRAHLGEPRLRVVATGGYAALMARGLKEIIAVAPALTLEGLRLEWQAHFGAVAAGVRRRTMLPSHSARQ